LRGDDGDIMTKVAKRAGQQMHDSFGAAHYIWFV
jgi:hypothetical protein